MIADWLHLFPQSAQTVIHKGDWDLFLQDMQLNLHAFDILLDILLTVVEIQYR